MYTYAHTHIYTCLWYFKTPLTESCSPTKDNGTSLGARVVAERGQPLGT